MMFDVLRVKQNDASLLIQLLDVFGEAFHDLETYSSTTPGERYFRELLGTDSIIVLVAMENRIVVGGLVAYELRKIERERSEIYIYDLAVRSSHRRLGIATALVGELKNIGAARNAWVIFVQADTGEEDAAAIALYSKLGTREEVLHFDIPLRQS